MSPTTSYDLSACCCGPDFPVVDCPDCDPAPLHYNFTFSGITDAVCAGCNVYNGGYLPEHVAGTCTWRQDAHLVWCGGNIVTRVLVGISGGVMFVSFLLITGGGGTFLWYQAKSSTTFDCRGRTIIDTLVVNNSGCNMSAILPFSVNAI
jgi:hypothetical protein